MPNQLDLEKTIQKEEIPEPPKWNIVLHNDDYTHPEFVCQLLAIIFHMRYEYSVQVMLKAHTTGKAIVANVSQADIAEMKVMHAMQEAKAHGFPLTLSVEKA